MNPSSLNDGAANIASSTSPNSPAAATALPSFSVEPETHPAQSAVSTTGATTGVNPQKGFWRRSNRGAPAPRSDPGGQPWDTAEHYSTFAWPTPTSFPPWPLPPGPPSRQQKKPRPPTEACPLTNLPAHDHLPPKTHFSPPAGNRPVPPLPQSY